MSNMRNTRRCIIWSCPRSFSTLLCRSFEQNKNCILIDEPFYPVYLLSKGFDHPFRKQLILHRCTNLDEIYVMVRLEPPNSDGFILQKHIAKNIDFDSDMTWINGAKHLFLIRNPEAIISSFMKATNSEELTIHDTGFKELYKMFNLVEQRDLEYKIINMDTFFNDVETSLKRICLFFGVTFTREMLSWDASLKRSNVLMGNTMSIYDSPFQNSLSKSTSFVVPSSKNSYNFTFKPTRRILRKCREIFCDLKKYADDSK